MEKASREAKVHTSWTHPDSRYEGNLHNFIDGVMNNSTFLADLEIFVEDLQPFARINSLSQILLKLTAPGIPDFYQGTELWDFSLVDPDNRQPVDYATRHRLLREVKCARVEQIIKHTEEGLPKLWTIYRGLSLRRKRPDLFGPKAIYKGLSARGSGTNHVLAFIRNEGLIVLVPRMMAGLAGQWGDTAVELPRGQWRNELSDEIFDGGSLEVSRLTEKFPVCLLTRESKS
jgi:(1->4)-alpha-D-glucan 1-alpha-D-glucosylmutase